MVEYLFLLILPFIGLTPIELELEGDISRWVTRNGHELLDMSKDGDKITFKIKKVK